MFTGLITAAAALLAGPSAALIDVRRARRAALVGLCVVIVGYISSLVALWAGAIGGFPFDEEAWGTVGLVFLTGIPASLFVALLGSSRGRGAGWCGVITCSLGFAGFMTALWMSSASEFDDEVWGISWSFVLQGLFLSSALVVPSVAAPLRWANLLLAPIAFICSSVLIMDWGDLEDAWATAQTWVILVAYTNLLLVPRLRGGQVLVRRATIIALTLLALVINLIAVGDLSDIEMLARGAAALAILAGCGTLAELVLVAVNHWRGEEARVDVRLEATCPRCREGLALESGKSRCERCGLRFTIRIEQPACRECGYLLYGGDADRCPECGTEVSLSAPETPSSP